MTFYCRYPCRLTIHDDKLYKIYDAVPFLNAVVQHKNCMPLYSILQYNSCTHTHKIIFAKLHNRALILIFIFILILCVYVAPEYLTHF